MYALTATVVHDQGLFASTGAFGLWADKVNLTYVRHARRGAPSSLESGRPNKSRRNAAHPSGSMRKSINGEVTRIGPRQIETVIYVDVPYALYVLKGTGPWIYSKAVSERDERGRFKGGAGMYLPGQPQWKAKRRQRVRGQKANNFLAEAFDKTARTHSSLAGYQMTI